MMDGIRRHSLYPNFEKIITVIRSRNISVAMILQSYAQLLTSYKDSAQAIDDCCDAQVLLGCNAYESAKRWSDIAGTQTQEIRTPSVSKSGIFSSQSIQYAARLLMTPSEVLCMLNSKCLVRIRGKNVIYDSKYPLEKHPNYRCITDGGAEPFDTKEYIRILRKNGSIIFSVGLS